MEFEQWEILHEQINVNACRACAVKNGHTIDEADNCEDGELNCNGCPWGETAQAPNDKAMPPR